MAYGLNNYENVTIQQFVEGVVAYDNANLGAQPISFTTVTTPQHRKKGFPYEKLYKVGQTAGMIGFDYEANVNAQREREGKTADFVKQDNNKVKEWLSKSIGITNKDNMVIRYRPLHNAKSVFVVFDKGAFRMVDNDEIKPFLYSYEGNSQGLDEQIQYRLYGVDKIISVSFLKKEYLIADVEDDKVNVFSLVYDMLKS